LKFLYDAHTLMVQSKGLGKPVSCDLQICTNMLSFMILWRMRRYKEAKGYVKASAELIKSILRK
jgi:hypothetical protein